MTITESGLVGKSVKRTDVMDKVTGCAVFVDDIQFGPSLLHSRLVRSPYSHALIKKIDTSKAEALPGVRAVVTGKDLTARLGLYLIDRPIFAYDRVRVYGEPVAGVVATSEDIAVEAVKLVEVEYEVLEPVLDFENAYESKIIIHPEPEIHEMFPIGFDPKKNVAAAYMMNVGDVSKTLAECDVVIEESFYTQAQAHVMMEPHTANARIDYQGRLVIYSSTQTPFHVRRILSQAMEYPLSKIRVIKPRIGGGYGGKQCLHGEFLVAAVTLRTGKPSKIVYTRKEERY